MKRVGYWQYIFYITDIHKVCSLLQSILNKTIRYGRFIATKLDCFGMFYCTVEKCKIWRGANWKQSVKVAGGKSQHTKRALIGALFEISVLKITAHLLSLRAKNNRRPWNAPHFPDDDRWRFYWHVRQLTWQASLENEKRMLKACCNFRGETSKEGTQFEGGVNAPKVANISNVFTAKI